MEHGARNDIPATATAIEGRGRDGPGRGGAGRRALTKAVDLPETPGFEDGGAVPLRARAANVLLVKPSRHRGGAPRRHRGGIAAASRQQHSRDLCRCGGPVIQPSSGRPRAAPPAHPTGCTHLMDWSDLPEDIPPSSAADASRMRLYITVGLIGMGALGMVGGMLHILPA
ncbi:hypothetical protein A3862_23910 [Methylobacterium sp. XJLW]|nr:MULTISPECIES: hypothetical protein [Methylobacterium]AWV18180.1 hypothetical protein A3862_23910 [Methylobacterium sp. XJLW]